MIIEEERDLRVFGLSVMEFSAAGMHNLMHNRLSRSLHRQRLFQPQAGEPQPRGV